MREADVHHRNAMKTLAFARSVGRADRALVVGCGDGREAGILSRELGADTIGIGFDDGRFDHEAAAPARLIEMDAQRLSFEDDSFDLVYSFHALEHIPDPRAALSEIGRVLQPGGRYLVGTPNKSRLFGYIGAAEPITSRIRSNVNDYRMRLSGRWSNELGAHAGFTRDELVDLCRAHVGPAEDMTDEYYVQLYPSKQRLFEILRRARLSDRIYPAVYVRGVVAP